jgi:sugar phosphate isomerase/epimerase
MKLSISNIAWTKEHDDAMYNFLKESGFKGLEIAPTRIFPENPYDEIEAAKKFSADLKQKYDLEICSMQSILFGRSEKLFGTIEERKVLLDYIKKAIDFAYSVGCKNLVFGSPKNRVIENDAKYSLSVEFFKELGDYAFENKTVLSMEANPTIYGKNFINTTEQAFHLVEDVKNEGFKVNIDFGAIIQNNENLIIISDNINLVNHIHISEPNLAPIEVRRLHNELSDLLEKVSYDKFISIEIKNTDDLNKVKQCMEYIKGVFDVN